MADKKSLKCGTKKSPLKVSMSLLKRYYISGWLDKKYFVALKYLQLYSPEDRYWAGKLFYADYLNWKKGTLSARDYEKTLVDGGMVASDWAVCHASEAFRRVLRHLSKQSLTILHKIVLEEQDVLAPKSLPSRERSYFNHEIKVQLCRGLDELVVFYKNKLR